MNNDDFRLITEYPVMEYKCGLRAGDRVRLKKDLLIKDHRNRPTGIVIPKGEIWTVLMGSDVGEIVVWFRQANMEPHTWPDDRTSIDEWFDILKDEG